jgi:hypothetical protein
MKVLNVSNGNYKVITKTNGTVTFDVGNDGRVYITGDLEVAGDVTTINSETLTVVDNIIRINIGGGSSTGILGSLDQQSGIEIVRGGTGEFADARLAVDDSRSHIAADGSSKLGTFVFKRLTGGTGTLMGIETCSIMTRGENLYLIGAPGDGIVSVQGTTDYERNVYNYTNFDLDPPTGPLTIISPDALPNAQAVKDYIDSNLAFFDDYSIAEDDTGIECFNATPGPYNYYRTLLDPAYVGPANSKIVFTVDGSERGQFNSNGLNVDNVRVLTDTVSNTNLTNDLILTATNNNVRIDGVAKLQHQASNPTAASSYSRVYAKDPGLGIGTPGKSGLYFVNTLTSDELVAKNRALLFSILF